MKKILAFFLCVALLLALTGCGNIHYKFGNYEKALEFYEKQGNTEYLNKCRFMLLYDYIIAKGTETESGNYALYDMRKACQWVKENIANFGGDPENITIAGESAGATAVYDMLAAPAAKGLFKRAIAQSGLASSACETFASFLASRRISPV